MTEIPEANLHSQATLRFYSLDTYDDWAPTVAEAIRPAMGMWDSAFLDPKRVPLHQVIDPAAAGMNYYGLYVGDELKAFAALIGFGASEVCLNDLSVPPAVQRQGWGSALLQLCEFMSYEAGSTSIRLYSTISALPFYEEKHGYVPHPALDEPKELVKWLRYGA